MPAKRVSAAVFKVRCLEILDELPPEGVVVTQRGKAVARLLPIAHSSASLVGCLKGKIEILGDLIDTRAM